MSIEKVSGQRTTLKWRVRWRDANGAHSKRVETKRQAEWLDGEIKRRKAIGGYIDYDRGRITLTEFYEQHYCPRYAVPLLQASTRATRAGHWGHIRRVAGHLPLREVRPETGAVLVASLDGLGLAPLTQRSCVATFQGILNRAVEWGYLERNPIAGIRRPPRRRARVVRPVGPVLVEAVRGELDLRGGTVVAIIAYAGLRPGEFRALTWDCIRERTIHVPEHVSKTGAPRTVRLFGPLSEDLLLWRAACPSTRDDLVMPSTWAEPWSHSAYNQWHSRTFVPAAKRAGWHDPRAYDLRHSFVSLLIQAGYQILDVARQAGHRPEETLRTYAHLFDEWAGDARVDPEEAIRLARVG